MAVDRYIKRGGAWVSPPSIYKKKDSAWIIPQLYTKRSGVWVNIDAVVAPPPSPPPPTLSASGGGTVSGTRVGTGDAYSSPATITASGGVTPYSYAWSYYSGDSIAITSPSSASSTFYRTLANGNSSSTVVKGTVTDALGATAFIFVTVNLSASYSPLVANAVPSNLSGTRNGAGYCTSNNTSVVVSGGSGSYSYAWFNSTGDGNVTFSNPLSATTNASANIANGQTFNNGSLCVVSDTSGQTAYALISITLTSTYVPPFSASASPTYASSQQRPNGTYPPTNSTTVTPVNGTAPYSYYWTVDSPSVTIESPTSATTRFFSSETQQPIATCTVTDAIGQTTQTSVNVDFISL